MIRNISLPCSFNKFKLLHILKYLLFFYIISSTNAEYRIKTNSTHFDVQDSENDAISLTDMERKSSIPINSYPGWSVFLRDEDTDCGESSADRIIGGTDASLGQYPWIARLGYIIKNDGVPSFKCGGSLISQRYVITAAHCLKTAGMRLALVRLGDYDSLNDQDCVSGICSEPHQDFAPAEIIWHRDFNNPSMNNDIGLILLDGVADFNGWVLPICLPTGSIGRRLNGTAEVAGWGIMDMFTMERATILQTVTIPIIPHEACVDFYKRTVPISDSQICAGGKMDEDSCGGDSGGPLMKIYDGIVFPQYFLIGIVSFGPVSCGSETPGVYTSVYHYMRWILDNVKY